MKNLISRNQAGRVPLLIVVVIRSCDSSCDSSSDSSMLIISSLLPEPYCHLIHYSLCMYAHRSTLVYTNVFRRKYFTSGPQGIVLLSSFASAHIIQLWWDLVWEHINDVYIHIFIRNSFTRAHILVSLCALSQRAPSQFIMLWWLYTGLCIHTVGRKYVETSKTIWIHRLFKHHVQKP